jgi:hypothetical protein
MQSASPQRARSKPSGHAPRSWLFHLAFVPRPHPILNTQLNHLQVTTTTALAAAHSAPVTGS